MTELSKDKKQQIEKTMDEMMQPPFPDKMSFAEMLTNLFNVEWMREGELKTICDAGELYANGCLRQELIRSQILIEALEKIIDASFYYGADDCKQLAADALNQYKNKDHSIEKS